jgi:hypothetical protein
MSGNDRRLIIWVMSNNRIHRPSVAVTNLQLENMFFSFVFRLDRLLKLFCFLIISELKLGLTVNNRTDYVMKLQTVCSIMLLV